MRWELRPVADLSAGEQVAVRTLPGLLAGFSEAESGQRPSPERWTKKEVLGHLIDSASNNHQRLVRGQLAGIIGRRWAIAPRCPLVACRLRRS